MFWTPAAFIEVHVKYPFMRDGIYITLQCTVSGTLLASYWLCALFGYIRVTFGWIEGTVIEWDDVFRGPSRTKDTFSVSAFCFASDWYWPSWLFCAFFFVSESRFWCHFLIRILTPWFFEQWLVKSNNIRHRQPRNSLPRVFFSTWWCQIREKICFVAKIHFNGFLYR